MAGLSANYMVGKRAFARTGKGRVRGRREFAFDSVELGEAVFNRALDVQELMAAEGHHRVPIPDLMVAAAAEKAELTVVHYDSDFDRIAEVTGQPTEWVVPRGTLDS